MADSVGKGFPTKGIQLGHLFFDIDENALYQYVGGIPTSVISWKLLSGVFSNDPDTSQWGNVQIGASWWNISLNSQRVWTGTEAINVRVGNIPYSLYNYQTVVSVQEDFLGGTSGLYWVRNLGSQAAAIAEGFPGITRLQTGAVSGTNCSYFMGSGVELIVPTYTVELTYIVRLNSNDGNTQFRFGAMVSGGTVDPPSNGWYFEKLDADTTWFIVARGGGVQTRTNTDITIDTNFHTFKIRYTGTTDVKQYYIDNVLIGTLSSNTLTGNIRPAFSIINSAAADKTFDIDYAQVEITGFLQRI